MGGPFESRSRLPGSTAVDPLAIKRPSLRYTGINWELQHMRTKGTLVAKIYFATGKDKLEGGDLQVLDDLAGDLKGWLDDENGIKIMCEGHTDPRGTEALNQGLAESRATVVENRLKLQLSGFENLSISHKAAPGRGPVHGKPDLLGWSEQRRVDVFEKLEFAIEIEDRNNPYKKYRADIFRNYHPDYKQAWKDLGLDHLLDEWERVESREEEMQLSPKDIEPLLKLIFMLDPKVHGLAVRLSRLPQATQELAKIYWVIHAQQWNDAVLPLYGDAKKKYMRDHPKATDEEVVKAVSSMKSN